MDTKDKITSTALKLFARYGYQHTTMDRIAQEAELGKGTLYWHFASKDKLFHELLDRSFSDYYTFLEKVQATPCSSQEKIQTIIDHYLQSCYQDHPFLQIIINAYEELDAGTKERLQKEQDQSDALIAQIFVEGMEQGELTLEDPYLTARFFNRAILSILFDSTYMQDKGKEYCSRILSRFIFHGLLTPHGATQPLKTHP